MLITTKTTFIIVSISLINTVLLLCLTLTLVLMSLAVCVSVQNAPPVHPLVNGSRVNDILETLDNGPMPILWSAGLTDLWALLGPPLTRHSKANMKRICIEGEHNLKGSQYFFNGNIYTIFYFFAKFLNRKREIFEFFCTVFNTAAYSVLIHRFHCIRGCWDWTENYTGCIDAVHKQLYS